MEKSLENEARLSEEIDQLKIERDNKIIEYQRLLDKERENYKQKLKDNDSKGNFSHLKITE